ncbi:MAG: hypothetical protein O2794_01995 [bacterium]|nr:hypothetical protein [bacterium]
MNQDPYRAQIGQSNVLQPDTGNEGQKTSLPPPVSLPPVVPPPVVPPPVTPSPAAPPPIAPPLGVPSSQQSTTHSNSSGNKSKILLVIVLLLLATSAAAGYGYFYTDYLKSPESLVTEALINLSKVDSMEYQGTVNVEFEYNPGDEETSSDSLGLESLYGPGTFSINMDGSYDRHDQENIAYTMNGKVDAKMGSDDFQFATSGGVSLIGMGEMVYMQLDLPSIFDIFGFDSIEDSWIRLDITDLEGGEALGITPNDIPSFNIDAIELVQKYNLIKSVNRLGSDAVGSRGAFHYSIELDKDALKGLYKELMELVYEESALLEQDPDAILLQEKIIDAIHINSMEIWIDKSKVLPLRVSTDISVDLNFKDLYGDDPDALSPTEGGIKYTIRSDVTYTSFNKELNIQAPEESKTFDEFFDSARQDSSTVFGSASEKGRDAQRAGDIARVRLALELYYDSNGSFPLHSGSSSSVRWSNLAGELTPTFIDVLPEDPGDNQYDYVSRDGKGYVVRAYMEDKGNPSLEFDDDGIIFGLQCADDVGAFCYSSD